MGTRTQATIEDLYRLPENGKGEIIDGEIVQMPATGDSPIRAGGSIYVSLRQHESKTGVGRAFTDNAAFKANLPHRQSFSLDAAFYTGPSAGMGFLGNAPDFAVEVRSEGDYGSEPERRLAEKRRDYFAAGTLVVWDVDLLGKDAIIKVYRATDPETPTIYRRGESAEAEPAVPGWRLPVDELFK
jgi:Uma2 family endonuclease